MWGSTQKMAEFVTEGLRQGGLEVKQMSMHSCHRSEVAHELLHAGALVIGTPVINSEMFPAMADVLCYLKGLKKKNLVGGAFGSYGWNPAPVNALGEWLKTAQVELAAPVVTSKFAPSKEVLEACRQLGLTVAQKVTEKTNQ
jgi:flavorubredoxin